MGCLNGLSPRHLAIVQFGTRGCAITEFYKGGEETIMSYTGQENSHHCPTCGQNYTPQLCVGEEGVREVVGSHNCPFPHSTFFVETKQEYEYREGVLYSRSVTFRRYSGHDTHPTQVSWAQTWLPNDKTFLK
jgi:hypothetical protein